MFFKRRSNILAVSLLVLLIFFSTLITINMINQKLFPKDNVTHHALTKNKKEADEHKSDRSEFSSLAVATRIHFKHQNKLNDAMKISIEGKFKLLCKQVSQYCNLLFVAVPLENETEIKQILNKVINEYEISSSKLIIRYIIVSPWIGYTSALNAIIRWISIKYKQVLYLSFQSLEITQLSLRVMNILMNELIIDDDTLVVGLKLMENQKEPWNTLSIYSLNKLRPFGFQLISDGIVQDIPAGIEEVVTMSVIQKINGQQENKCKLIQFNSLNNNDWKWDNNNLDLFGKEREKYHKHKIQSKTERANKQLSAFKQLSALKVIEISYDLL